MPTPSKATKVLFLLLKWRLLQTKHCRRRTARSFLQREMSFYNKKDILFLGLPALDWHPLLFLIWAMIISINLFLSHDKSTSTWIENNFPPEYSPTFVDLEFEEDKREWLAATPSTLLVPKTLARASPPRPPGIIGSQCQIGQLQISDGSVGWKLESTSDRRASDPSWFQTWRNRVAFICICASDQEYQVDDNQWLSY